MIVAWLRLGFLLAGALAAGGAQPRTGYDIVVYGGTSAAGVAAVQAQRMGKTVVIVSPDRHLGGLSSGGLGFTDTGNKCRPAFCTIATPYSRLRERLLKDGQVLEYAEMK